MASATSKAVGYVVPVLLIIAVLFFFLETKLGRKLLNDLKNALLVGSTDHGGSDNQNTNNLITDSSGGTKTATPPTIPPPDVTSTLKNNSPSSGGSGGGNDKSKSSDNTSTSDGFGNGQPIPGIDLTGGVKPLIIPGVPSNKNPTVTPMIASVFDENTPIAVSASVPTNKELLTALEVGVTPKEPLAPIAPVPNPQEPIAVSTPPLVAKTPVSAPSQSELNTITKIPNPLPQEPNLLSEIEGIPNNIFNFVSKNPIFRLQPAPFDFFNSPTEIKVPIEGIPAI